MWNFENLNINVHIIIIQFFFLYMLYNVELIKSCLHTAMNRNHATMKPWYLTTKSLVYQTFTVMNKEYAFLNRIIDSAKAIQVNY